MKHSFPLLIAVVAAIALMPGCMTPVKAGTTTSDASEIRDQLFKLQKDSAKIIDGLEQLHQGRGTSAENANLCAEAVTKIGELQHQLEIIEEQLMTTQRRLDAALGELRAQRRTPPPSWLGTSTPGAATPTATATSHVVAPVTAPGIQSSQPAIPLPTGNMNADDLFNSAYSDYSRGRFELALAGFEGALRTAPEGSLADDSQYWIGECLTALKRYEDSVKAFDHLITAYPDSDKVPRAYLKKGIAQFEARRKAEGVQTLEYVISTWPDSDEARIAREYFRRKGILQE